MVTIPASALQPNVDVAQASRHLELLHVGAPGFASIVLLGNGRHERHCFFSTSELIDSPSTVDGARTTLQDIVDARWNVYIALSTFAQVPDRGRGTRADVLTVPGVWADIDIKPDTEGYFTNERQVQDYVRHLPKPTLEIASGSGGRHLYWLTHQRLNASAGQDLLTMWLDYLRAESPAIIENVHDTTRVLRLAGTVRWPKVADQVAPMPRPVVLLHEGPRYHVQELELLARTAHNDARQKRDEGRQRRRETDRRRMADLESRGLEEQTYDRVVRMFNAQQDWEPLLAATGWTLHSDQRDMSARCRYWTRPGKKVSDGKSASTDFIAADGMASRLMTIYSNDPALHDLWENTEEGDVIGTCSKWTYALSRLFTGDEIALLRCAVAGQGRLS